MKLIIIQLVFILQTIFSVININLIEKQSEPNISVSLESKRLIEDYNGDKYFEFIFIVRNNFDKEIDSFKGNLTIYEDKTNVIGGKLKKVKEILIGSFDNIPANDFIKIKTLKEFVLNEDETLSKLSIIGWASSWRTDFIVFTNGDVIKK